MNNYKDDVSAIMTVLTNYFNGIFNGDAALLKNTIYQQSLVAGDVNGQPYFKNAAQYIEGVKSRKSPFELNEVFRMEIVGIEIINSIAMAKVHVPIFEFNYYDFLSLHKINGEWLIINKLLTNVKTSTRSSV